MKSNILFLVGFILLFTSCGKTQEELKKLAEDNNGTNETNAPGTEISLEKICEITSFSDSTENCTKIIYQGSVLMESKIENSTLTLVASKKNGGAGGSAWFNIAKESSTAVQLQLPNIIPATGNAGNGQKLYVLFNKTVDCAWYSSASTRYQNFRCFQGATRNSGKSSGFVGGTELFINSVSNVTLIEMSLNGANGSGVITTATAQFLIQ